MVSDSLQSNRTTAVLEGFPSSEGDTVMGLLGTYCKNKQQTVQKGRLCHLILAVKFMLEIQNSAETCFYLPYNKLVPRSVSFLKADFRIMSFPIVRDECTFKKFASPEQGNMELYCSKHV